MLFNITGVAGVELQGEKMILAPATVAIIDACIRCDL